MKEIVLCDYKSPSFEIIAFYSEYGFATSINSEQPDGWTQGVHDWFEE